MAEVTYAEPTTRTPLHFDVLPEIKQASPLTTTAPSKQPFTADQNAPGQLARPSDYHAQPHTTPSIQEQIRRDGETWKTIDVVPKTSAPPQSQEGNLGMSMAMRSSSSQLSGEIANEAVFYTSGLLNGFFPIPDNSYSPNDAWATRGQKSFSDLGKEHGQKLRELWDDRPEFEIPKIQLPKFTPPELPKFDIPKIPEFDIPKIPKFDPQPKPKEPVQPGQPKPTVDEPKPQPQPEPQEKDIPRLKEPAPKPIPKDLTRQLRELDLSPCGSLSFSIAYTSKVLGVYYVDTENGFREEKIEVASSVDKFLEIARQFYPDIQLGSAGGSGSTQTVDLGNGTSYITFGTVSQQVSENESGYPFYVATPMNISVNGKNSKSSVGAILDHLSETRFPPEVYDIQVSQPNNEDCPIGKPPPPTPPPPPPPEDCDCMAKCCPDLDLRQIKALMTEVIKETKLTINVPVVECKQDPQTGKWEAKTTQKSLEVFAASQEQADQIAALHIANAEQATQLCEAKNNDEAVASIPLFWQIRHEGNKPQMVIQCAEKSAYTETGSAKYDSAKYPITVPHWKGGQNDKPSLPSYKKGNWEGILVLADNSKVTINAQNEAECIKILNAVKPWIDSKMLENSYFKGGKIKTKEPIKETQVYPKYGRYFGKGQKNGKPDWRVDFP